MRRACALPAALVVFGLLPAAASAAQSARLHVTFSSQRPGHDTNIGIDVAIATRAHRVPSPVTSLDIRFPNDLGFSTSELGLSSCAKPTLQAHGPAGCPPDSWMGRGTALAEVPFGPLIEKETADVVILRAPEDEGRIAMYFDVHARMPILAEIILPGVLLPTPAPYETIHISVPIVGTLPGAPDASLVHLHANIGPRGLTYYEDVRGKRVPYHPRGILLPSRCPRNGFPFSATMTFLDGTGTTARDRVPCRGRG